MSRSGVHAAPLAPMPPPVFMKLPTEKAIMQITGAGREQGEEVREGTDGQGEEVREGTDEVQLAYRHDGCKNELAFVVLQPRMPGHGTGQAAHIVCARRWISTPSALDDKPGDGADAVHQAVWPWPRFRSTIFISDQTARAIFLCFVGFLVVYLLAPHTLLVRFSIAVSRAFGSWASTWMLMFTCVFACWLTRLCSCTEF